jgi:DNA helicase-2/ATP-dependent DNA helicase PcrA
MKTATADALLADLNDAQREAVTSEAAPLCILAGAGSGKTRVLTRRIAYRSATGALDPRHVLALTFTRKAAGELRSRLGKLGVRDHVVAGTFHAVAYAQLRRRWADNGTRPPALLERKVSLLVGLLPSSVRRRGRGPAGDTVSPADIAGEIEWAKARRVGPGHYAQQAEAHGRRPPLPPGVIGDIYAAYEKEKRRRGMVDFDDLLLLCRAALDSDPEFAAAQRWQFRHLFVDEFQDVNPAQYALLEAWVGGGTDFCVVGDPNQAIYAWNGADSRYLDGFRELHPGAGLVRLTDNYRSTPQVLAIANAVLGGGLRRSPPLRATCDDGDIPTVRGYPTDTAEAKQVAKAIRGDHGPGRRWSRNAVLARTHAQLVLFEEALRAIDVPCRVRGGGRFLDQPEVRAVIKDLKSAPVQTMAHVIADLREAIDGTPDDANAPAVQERKGHLEALLRLADEYVALDREGALEGFLAWLTATVRSDDAETGDAVELATFHAAKGLEWPVVFVVGLERGLIPIAHADTPAAVAEERRLLYVAVTRAREALHCSWAERRTFGTRTLARSASPYLADVEATIEALGRGESGIDWKAALAQQRTKIAEKRPKGRRPLLGEGSNADPQILEALRSWRATTAKASGVPAFVICHDSTLTAVAEARPQDRRALLAVPGMGPVKVDRYGEELLALVAHAS